MTKTICALVVAFFTVIARGATPLDPNSIPLPTIPDRTFNITDFGGIGDGKTLNTDAFAKAIDAIRAAGGGKLIVPAGEFLTGPIQLTSSMELRVEKGATLRLAGDARLYRVARVELYPG